ncbi:hypothetical protein DW870_04080 [Collinsella sp. AM38-1BH]|nr:hypothetical protein DXB53_05500 [Collinsella sp. OM04-5]RGR39930.1 hypothetical protein DWY51_06370 [Collinsella sp. AF25-2LB]RHB81765.1 hypothetical protein DW870_04080 [Collinsella sp. AM38-1BH]
MGYSFPNKRAQGSSDAAAVPAMFLSVRVDPAALDRDRTIRGRGFLPPTVFLPHGGKAADFPLARQAGRFSAWAAN